MLENSIKDVIGKKLEDGTIEKLVAEQLEKGVLNALDSLFRSYGDVTKVIEDKIKSVMVPYLEEYDYSEYIVKLDSVLLDVLKNCALDNKKMLTNSKELMLPEDRKTIKASELFDIWCKYVAKEVDTTDLEIDYDDGPTYEPVTVRLDVDYNNERSWSLFEHANLILECEHDEEMNFAIPISHYKNDKKENQWSISSDQVKDISSLRHINDFRILLMRLDQAGTKLIMDTDSECDDITPEKEPEATYE
ncbi:hypothetical protein SPSIL_057660 [Sporomusa silvacetica DSM 10669]|uniref:Phage protein n=1 Tax=Sporomusa silvacetica DSM 10669 TaxID=1123289 RepID=A0ABZ3IV45_9FIRM|nr:hypothetical protein [Sporomusa silvacetica]OZC14286.1 hypothetical protein SPSIL_50130 [Sporomusa silvacetica DSM 10669]